VPQVPAAPNQRWSFDFTSDQLADGRRFRPLNIVDDFTREALAIEPHTSIPGSLVIRVREQIAEHRGYPKSLITDDGPSLSDARSTPGRTSTGFGSISSTRQAHPECLR